MFVERNAYVEDSIRLVNKKCKRYNRKYNGLTVIPALKNVSI